MDIAVKDPRAPTTGWVFATYVYDESLPAATPEQRWYNMTPVGLQWGNDEDVTAPGDPDLDESWINAGVPAPFNGHVGLHGRLNGPVDNPVSACMSCHSTAQVRDGQTAVGAYTAAKLIPADTCSDAQKQYWFRSIPGDQPFGQMNGAPGFCVPSSPPTASPPMHALDYSLQIQRGLVNGIALDHANPCLSEIPPEQLPSALTSNLKASLKRGAMNAEAARNASHRVAVERPKRVAAKLPDWKKVGMQPDPKQVDYYPGR
jgi:hypothetical protein